MIDLRYGKRFFWSSIMLVATGFSVFAIWLYVVRPAEYWANSRHVLRAQTSFLELASFMEEHPTILRVVSLPDRAIEVDWIGEDHAEVISKETMDNLVQLFSETKVDFVTRDERFLEFYGSSEVFLGRRFEVRVIKMDSVAEAFQADGVENCDDVNTHRKMPGACIDPIGTDWAIHYFWTSPR